MIDKKKLIDDLKKFSREDIISIEKEDPQYKAIENLYRRLKDPVLFSRLVVINALLAYQLRMKGEKYWEEFSTFFSVYPSQKYFPQFLHEKNNRFLMPRLKRLERSKRCVKFLKEDKLKYYCNNLSDFNKKIATCMNQKEDAKTVVFSSKMFLYACRIIFNEDFWAEGNIFIPMDSRILKISSDRKFWKEVSEETNIPLLHIDAVLWLDKLND